MAHAAWTARAAWAEWETWLKDLGRVSWGIIRAIVQVSAILEAQGHGRVFQGMVTTMIHASAIMQRSFEGCGRSVKNVVRAVIQATAISFQKLMGCGRAAGIIRAVIQERRHSRRCSRVVAGSCRAWSWGSSS